MAEEDTELQKSESGRTSVRSTISNCAINIFLSGYLLLATVREGKILG